MSLAKLRAQEHNVLSFFLPAGHHKILLLLAREAPYDEQPAWGGTSRRAGQGGKLCLQDLKELNLYTQKISWRAPLKSSGTADVLGLPFRVRGYVSSLGFFWLIWKMSRLNEPVCPLIWKGRKQHKSSSEQFQPYQLYGAPGPLTGIQTCLWELPTSPVLPA